ncbi:MAG: hypothetical protein NC099_03335 [Corallococcus sp.]|nr:hypothetical protein [Corallococcus sp.]
MRKALYIPSSPSKNKDSESNRWCYIENGEYHVGEKDLKDSPTHYLSTTTEEDVFVYLANDGTLAYLSKKQFGSDGKDDMIYVYTDSSVVSKIKTAECIGCTIPQSLYTELQYPYSDKGENIDQYLQKEPQDLGWFERSEYHDDHEFSTVIVPITDKLISLLLKKEKREKHCSLLLKSNKLNVREHEQLLKRVLMSLPLSIANKFSFNTNADHDAALNNIDVACAVSNFELSDENKSSVEEFDVDNGKTDFEPETKIGKYIKKRGEIPQAVGSFDVTTAEQLEEAVSDIELLEICQKEINCADVNRIRELYESASDKIKKQVEERLSSAAYRILLSEDYFQLGKDEPAFLSAFLTNTGTDSFTQQALYRAIVKAVSARQEDEGSKYLRFLFGILTDRNMITCAENAVKDVLYKGEWINEKLKATAERFLVDLGNRFESYLEGMPSDLGAELTELIKLRISNTYRDGKDKIALYLRVVNNFDNCAWLAESIFNSDALRTCADLEEWEICHRALEEKSNPDISILERQFTVAFTEFLGNVGFDKAANDVYVAIDSDDLKLIKSAAQTFKYTEKGFEDKMVEIDGIEKRNSALDVMLYRRCQFILKANYPTDKSQKRLFKKCNDSEDTIKKTLITTHFQSGHQKESNDENKRRIEKLRQFFKGFHLGIFIQFILLIGVTWILHAISANGYGWKLFGSILGVSTEGLRMAFYITVTVLYFAVYLWNIFSGLKKDVKVEIIASKAFFAAVIVILLPCIGVTLFMRFIG